MRKSVSQIFDELVETKPHTMEDEKLTYLWVWLSEGLELSPEQVKNFLECTNPSMIGILRKKKLEEMGESGKQERQKEAMAERVALNAGDILVRF